MKIRILDRILVALAGLMMIASVAALAAQLFFGKDVAGKVASWLNNDSLRVYIIIAGILVCIIGVYCVLLLFRHKGKNGKFIMQRTESGELAISLKALESMVQKCLDQHKEVNAQAVSLDNQKGSLLIRIRGTVAGGVSIPLTVSSLQQQIKQYVTACSGVEVKDIRVEIESSGPDATNAPFAIEAPAAIGLLKGAGETLPVPEEKKPEEPKEAPITPEPAETAETPAPVENTQMEDELTAAAAAAAMLMDKAPEEEDDRPMHQRLFSMVEEPCVMPMPPMNLEQTGKEENKPEAKEASEEKKPEENKPEEIRTEESKPQEPKAEDNKPAKEQTEEPNPEEPKTGEPKAEEPKAEEPKAEEPKAEEPKEEEPRAEETKAEESKPAKVKTNWFRNKKAKAKGTGAEETKDERTNAETTVSAVETAVKEATETREEGGIID